MLCLNIYCCSETEFDAMQTYAEREVTPLLEALTRRLVMERPADALGFLLQELAVVAEKRKEAAAEALALAQSQVDVNVNVNVDADQNQT